MKSNMFVVVVNHISKLLILYFGMNQVIIQGMGI
jgi:hypothetical protein